MEKLPGCLCKRRKRESSWCVFACYQPRFWFNLPHLGEVPLLVRAGHSPLVYLVRPGPAAPQGLAPLAATGAGLFLGFKKIFWKGGESTAQSCKERERENMCQEVRGLFSETKRSGNLFDVCVQVLSQRENPRYTKVPSSVR